MAHNFHYCGDHIASISSAYNPKGCGMEMTKNQKIIVDHEENTNKLREARHKLLREKRRAKRKWQYEYAEKCKKRDFILNPKEAWRMVFKLMEGF